MSYSSFPFPFPVQCLPLPGEAPGIYSTRPRNMAASGISMPQGFGNGLLFSPVQGQAKPIWPTPVSNSSSGDVSTSGKTGFLLSDELQATQIGISPAPMNRKAQKTKKTATLDYVASSIDSRKAGSCSLPADEMEASYTGRGPSPIRSLPATRATGAERYEEILDPDRRRKSQSDQIKQVKLDLARLLLTTNTHSALLIIPPSLRVQKFATAGDFNTFLKIYAASFSAQRKSKGHPTNFRIDDVWERFQGRGGLHQIETLCSALLDEGCEEALVEDLKDAYLAALATSEDSKLVQGKLARHLTDALRAFIETSQQE